MSRLEIGCSLILTGMAMRIARMGRMMMSRLEIGCSLILTGMAMSALIMALYVMVFML